MDPLFHVSFPATFHDTGVRYSILVFDLIPSSGKPRQQAQLTARSVTCSIVNVLV
jgi:hypothetical protein